MTTYNQKITDLFHTAKYYGRLDSPLAIRSAKQFAADQDSSVEFLLTIEDLVITNIGYLAKGNPVIIACCEYAARELHNSSIYEMQSFDYTFIADKLELNNNNLHGAILVHETLGIILAEYNKTETSML